MDDLLTLYMMNATCTVGLVTYVGEDLVVGLTWAGQSVESDLSGVEYLELVEEGHPKCR